MIKVIVVSMIVFLVIGIMLGNFMDSKLKKNEEITPISNSKSSSTAIVTLEGTVSYVGPDYLPEYQISYTLTDNAGNDIVLLKSSDEKLEIVQGLFVKVTGRKSKTPDEKYEVLQVNEVVINNGTN